MDRWKKNPISTLITLYKQVNCRFNKGLNIGDMPTTLGIYISIISEFRDVSSENFQDYFSLRNIDF